MLRGIFLNRQLSAIRRWLGLVAVTALSLTGLCQAPLPAARHISGEDLAADLQILQHAYKAMHPGLLRYNTEAQIDADFDQERAHLASGATPQQAFAHLALLSAEIQCGHTYPNFFNQSKEVVDSVLRGTSRLPFYFTWIDQRMVVTRDLTADHSLPAGTEVLRLNRIDARKVLLTLIPYVRGDGANDAKRVALLGVSGESQWEAFDIYYPLVFPLNDRSFELAVQRPGEETTTLFVPAMSDTERELIRKSTGTPGPNDPVFSKRVLTKKIEVIRMPSWGLFNSRWDWKTWLDTAIDDAVSSHAPELILDLRGNEGGDDEVGRFILSRLIARPLTIENYARLVKYRTAPKDVEPYLDTWDKSFLRLGVDAKPFTTTLPHLPPGDWFGLSSGNSHAGTESILPRKARYTGRVVVLIDAQNSSATFQFADAIRQNHLGLLVGEPTGGNQRGINGGAFFFLRLPHSGIEIDLPLIGYFAQADRQNTGLRPDKEVPTTVKDVAMSRDPQILAAEALVP